MSNATAETLKDRTSDPTNFGRLETTNPRTGKVSALVTSHSHRNLPSQRALDIFCNVDRAAPTEVAPLLSARISWRKLLPE